MSKKKNTPKIVVKSAPELPKTPNSKDTLEPKARADTPFFTNNKWQILIISILAIAIYAQSIGFDYALDDTMVITKNQFTQKGINGISDIFRYESFRGYFGEQKQLLEGDRYRPLSIATFAVEQSLFGGNRAISHAINVLLYALTGVFLYRILLMIFPIKNASNTESAASAGNEMFNNSAFDKGRIAPFFTLPFIATLLFISHPLHVEVVANIKGRDEIIALLGELGALYFTFKYLHFNKIKYLIYSFLSFYVGLLSKESVITFLAIIPLTAHFFTKSSTHEKIKVTIPIIGATVLYLLMRVQAIGYLMDDKVITDLMNNPFYGMAFSDKIATIFYTLLIYLKLHIFPHPLTHDYYPFHIPRMTWGNWQVWLSASLHVGLVALILRGCRSRSVWAYCALFYLAAMSIVSNVFVSVGTFMNERFAYHASLAFCIALAYFFTQNRSNMLDNGQNIKPPITLGLSKWMPNNVALSIAGLFIIGFSFKTMQRVPDWRNGTTLNESAIKNAPNSARANCFFAVSTWENRYTKFTAQTPQTERRACLDSMKRYFDRSVEILPKYGSAQKMRAAVAAEYHKLDKQIEPLLKTFGEVNLSGTYEKFVVEYLQYINGRDKNAADSEKLKVFYEQMKKFYEKNYPNSGLATVYQKMKDQLSPALPNENQPH